MKFMDGLRFGYEVMTRPATAAKRSLSAGEAIKIYYKLSVIPFLLYVAISIIIIEVGLSPVSSVLSSFSTFFSSAISIPLILITAIFTLWVAIPLGIAINSFFYQVVGKVFLNVWKGSYDKTFTAVMMAELPALMLYWLLAVPGLNFLYIVLVGIWQYVVLVIALSVQQKTTRLGAAAAVLITVAAIITVVLLIIFGFVGSIFQSGLVHGFPVH
ncbi:MAG: hypothetical protein KGH53_00550 [Candidatus Micrarchaeota archaeon]|nr:hypothetical protein [Candidatus Micrarchaeota archaeon]